MSYDEAGAAFVRAAASKPIHIYDERPGVLGLLPVDLEGKHVLDAGCGGGWLSLQVEYVVRPLSGIFDALANAGWRDTRIHEPQPLDGCQHEAPELWATLRARPWFLFLTARRR